MKKQNINSVILDEMEFVEEILSLDGKEILDLGCGSAYLTRLIATNGVSRKIIATEVDEIQHSKNILIDDLPNVTFVKAGSEALPLDKDSIDVAFMFKSLHHIPIELMGTALKEVKRVLKPGGIAYISEPTSGGDFNEVLCLFHDEFEVKEAATKAITKSVNDGELSLKDEFYFSIPIVFESFEEFERNIIDVTYTNHKLSPELHQKVKDKFLISMADNLGNFLLPLRVNILHNVA